MSAQQNKETRRATKQMIEKRSKRKLKKEILIIVKNIVLAKNWFVVSNF